MILIVKVSIFQSFEPAHLHGIRQIHQARVLHLMKDQISNFWEYTKARQLHGQSRAYGFSMMTRHDVSTPAAV